MLVCVSYIVSTPGVGRAMALLFSWPFPNGPQRAAAGPAIKFGLKARRRKVLCLPCISLVPVGSALTNEWTGEIEI